MKKIVLLMLLFHAINGLQAQTSPIVWQTLLNDYPTIPASSSTIDDIWIQRTIGLSNGDLLMVGSAHNEALIERRSSSGSKIWEMRLFGSNGLNDVLEVADGSIYIAGSSGGSNTIVNKNFITNTVVTDLFYHTQNNTYSCNKCTFRSINEQPFVQTSITTAIDWEKGSSNMLLMKLSEDGIINWVRQFGGSGIENGYSVVKADNNNVWLVGNSYSATDEIDIIGTHHINTGVQSQYADIMAIKVSPAGEKLLSKFYGSSENEAIYNYNQVVSSNDGGFTMVFKNSNAGTVDGDFSDATSNDFNRNVVFKIGPDANIQWKKYMSYGEFNAGNPMKITQTTDGNYFLLDNAQFGGLPSSLPIGYHSFVDDYLYGTNIPTHDVRVTKLNNTGVEQWHKYYGGKYDEGIGAPVISPTIDGGAILMVDSSSPDGDVEGSHAIDPWHRNDCWVVKIDENGTIQWNRAFGGTDNEINYGDRTSIALLQDGNFVFSVITSRSNDGDLVGNIDGIYNQATWLVKFQMPCFSAPPTAVTQNQRVCAGTVINLNATCEAGTSVKWYEDNGTTLLVSSTIAPTTTTFYRVRCEDNLTNCISASTQTKIWVNPNPSPSITSNHVICANTSVYLTASCSGPVWGTTGVTRYENDGTTILSNSTVTPTTNISTYKIRCETTGSYLGGELTCKSPFTDVTVTKIAFQSEPILTTQSQTICIGSSIILSATCNIGSNVAWYDDYYGSPLTNLTVSPTSYKTYYVRCESGGTPNCKSTPQVINIYINSTIPEAPNIGTDVSNITAGENITLTATACSGTIKWNNLNATMNPLTIVPITTTNYTAKCVVNGCESISSSAVNIVVNCPQVVDLSSTNAPTGDINAGKITKLANSNSGTISATNKITGTAKVTYQAKNIQLNAGFKADNGTVFKAEVGGCQ